MKYGNSQRYPMEKLGVEPLHILDNYRVEIDKIDKTKWNELLNDFNDSSIYQTWSYGEIRWGKNNLSHVILRDGDKILAMAQVAIRKIPVMPFGVAYVPWGPIWQRKGSDKLSENFLKIIRVLKEEYARRKGLYLRINPNIIEDGNEEVKLILEKEGYRLNESYSAYRTLLLDLSPNISQLRKGLNAKWRNQLNAAEKKGLAVVVGDSKELYDSCLRLQKEMQVRKDYVPGVNYHEFGEIQQDLSPELKMKIMICEKQGEAVACAMCSAIGNTGIYILGATGNKGINLKGSYLLQWRVIEWLKAKNYEWYDLGGINPEKNAGVYHFKAGLSGKEVKFIGTYDLWQNLISFFLVKGKEAIEEGISKLSFDKRK